jgi:hypothetical protein
MIVVSQRIGRVIDPVRTALTSTLPGRENPAVHAERHRAYRPWLRLAKKRPVASTAVAKFLQKHSANEDYAAK